MTQHDRGSNLNSADPLTWAPGCDIIDGVREVPLSVLGKGQRFTLVLSTTDRRIFGTVIDRYAGSVLVEFDESKGARSFTTGDGEVITFGAGKSRQNWSLNTPVLIGVHPSKGETEMATERAVGLPGVTKTQARPAAPAAKPKLTGAAAAAHAKAQAGAKTPKQPKQLNSCLCGCGDKVAGRFRQGHDSRYYSLIKKVIAGELGFDKLPRIMRDTLVNVNGAKKALAAHG